MSDDDKDYKETIKLWAFWAMDYYKTSWEEFLGDNVEVISTTTRAVQSNFLEFLMDKFTYNFRHALLTGYFQMPIPKADFNSAPPTTPGKIINGSIETLGSGSDSLSASGPSNLSTSPILKAEKEKREHKQSSPIKTDTEGESESDGQVEQKVKSQTPPPTCNGKGCRNVRFRSPRPTARKPCECLECGLKFEHAGSLFLHRKWHAGQQTVRIEAPDDDGDNQTRHTQPGLLTKSEEPTSYKCKDCGKRYTHLSSLTKHERLHSGKNLHKCKVCEKAFTTPSDLKRHVATHSTERPFECIFCEKSFKTKNQMSRHQRERHPFLSENADLSDLSFDFL